jgi:hypothetical protein
MLESLDNPTFLAFSAMPDQEHTEKEDDDDSRST